MDFISNKENEINEMLQAIGVGSIEELFADVPKEIFHQAPTDDDGLSEFEGIERIEEIGKQNTFVNFDHYLGAGAYDHHVPAIVSFVTQKSKFLTAYTPYQAEISQGMLQAIFEYQSCLSALTGMDVANASVYDGASACAEGLLMAVRATRRNKVLISKNIHPHYRKVIDLYLNGRGIIIEDTTDSLSEDVAAVLVQSPNFFGVMEEVAPLAKAAHEVQALLVLSANPMAYGIYQSAADLGADIAVGDMQPFGLPLQFGGPYSGYMATKKGLVRQLPGRIVGETIDKEGKKGYVLTLQAREQHIRREKSTSNICTNQALAALANLIALLWWGKEGVQKVALTNFQRASYLRDQLHQLPNVTVGEGAIFNEFTVDFGVSKEKVDELFQKNKIIPGHQLPNGQYLVAVTEKKSKKDLDRYIEVAKCL